MQGPVESGGQPEEIGITREADTEPLEPIQVEAAPTQPIPEERPHALRHDPAEALYEWEFKMPESPRRAWAWACASVILAIALVAQAAYGFRTDLMVMLPQARDYYVRACVLLDCAVGLPKVSSFLHIEASDLNAVDAARPNEIQLLLSIRNRAPVELAYPSFELTLTDSVEKAVARKVFTPAEYLKSEAATGGIKPGGDLPVQLYLDTGAMRAAGYRVYLFYQ